jgi:outer membrane protein assembly factor BamB
VDGLVDAEPLYASSVSVPGNGTHNLLIVPTEHGSVYAFDADSGTTIWQITTLKTGETRPTTEAAGKSPLKSA